MPFSLRAKPSFSGCETSYIAPAAVKSSECTGSPLFPAFPPPVLAVSCFFLVSLKEKPQWHQNAPEMLCALRSQTGNVDFMRVKAAPKSPDAPVYSLWSEPPGLHIPLSDVVSAYIRGSFKARAVPKLAQLRSTVCQLSDAQRCEYEANHLSGCIFCFSPSSHLQPADGSQ